MAPPLPPPGVPDFGGLAAVPMAWLPANTLLRIVQDTPMLTRCAPPLEHALPEPSAPPKVLLTT